ncbi:MAG: ATP-binding cassette domain-containing protein [Gammaproteobacteria bacterium]|nr:ATP-binding cassette domain-containing protein [Gammaproteobacteria bacterium]
MTVSSHSAPSVRAPSVCLREVSLRYEDTVIAEHLSVELPGGRCTCLLGTSGVGKTTLLRFVAGLVAAGAAKGQVDTSDGLPLAGRVAYMAQRDLLVPWLSVIDNVLIGARFRHESISGEVRGRARQLLDELGLSSYADALPAALSGGMRQRTALARTLFEDRPIVLMDEPFSSLDVITRHRLQTLAATRLADRTALLITHDPMEALRLGHVIYVLEGRPVELSEPIYPSDLPPRSVEREDILVLYGKLLERLGGAAART